MFQTKIKVIVKKLAILLFSLAAIFSSNAFAKESVATVNVDQIVHESTQCKLIQYDIQKDFLAKKGILEEKKKIIQGMMIDYNAKKSKLSEKSLEKLANKIIEKKYELQKLALSFEKSISKEQYEKNSEILAKIKSAVQSTASKNKIDIVVPENVLLYHKAGTDITGEILKTID